MRISDWSSDVCSSDLLGGTTEAGPSPTFGDFLLSLIPTNPISAAAETAILPLIVFTTIFAFAITRLDPVQRATLSGLFKALGHAMLIVIGWVLALAPIGVFALGYALAVKAGFAAFGGLRHYVLILMGIGVSCIILGLLPARSEERRVGKECGRTYRTRGVPEH